MVLLAHVSADNRGPWYWVDKRLQIVVEEDGVTLFDAAEEERTSLLFTRSEWDAFLLGLQDGEFEVAALSDHCLLYTSPSPRD